MLDNSPEVQAPTANDDNLLAGYVEQEKFAMQHGINPRTVARYRNLGLPWLPFGGRVYIPLAEAGEWLRSQVRHPNRPQRPRRAT
jgi:hypothetical protein